MSERDLFTAALQITDPAERAVWLDGACGADAALRQRIEVLLQALHKAGSLLENPAVAPQATGGQTGQGESASEAGTLIAGKYKLLEQIGEGGMGTVWMAQQTEPVKRLVAVKLIKPGMDSKQVLARFEAERQALALMDHPNIAKVHDAGTTGSEPDALARDSAATLAQASGSVGRPFFVMELVKGVPITKYCDEHQLTPRQRLELFVPVCQAIQHAHHKGIIHRDLKPSNVLVALYDDKPVPKVIDFGVAKATGQQLTEETLHTGFGTVVGTVEYMSPEQASLNQLDVDTRSDIYSLGIVLYELLAGSPPFTRKDLEKAGMLEMLRMIREQEPSKPSTKLSTADGLPTLAANRGTEPAKLTKLVRGELDWIVMKALEKDRSRRYETANGFAMDVQRYLADEPVLACPPSAGYRLRKFVRRNKRALMTLALLAVMLVVAVGTVAGILGWAVRDREALEQEVARDLAERQQALEQEITRALDESETSYQRGRLQEATAALKQAEGFQASGLAKEELAERVRQRRADLAMVGRLEEIRLERAAEDQDDFDWAGADAAYQKAFRDYGLDVDALHPAETAKRIGASAVKESLVAALDDWLLTRKVAPLPGAEQLSDVVRGADADPWRNRLRDALLRRDGEALKKLALDKDVLSLPPPTVDFLGTMLGATGQVPLAVEVLGQAQQRHPADFWINHDLGQLMYRRLKPPQSAKAAGYLRVAVALRPESALVYMNLGLALSAQGAKAEAEAAFRKALQLKPDYVRAHLNLGVVLRDQGKLKEGEDEYREAIRLKPDYAKAHLNLGSALRKRDALLEAEIELREAIRLLPDYAEAHESLGSLHLQQGKLAAAEAEYREAIRVKPEYAAAHYNLGVFLAAQKRLDDASACYRKAIALDPNDALFHYSLGNALSKQNKLDGAIACFNKAIELKPDYAEAWNNRGGAYRDLRQYDKDRADRSRAIELKPDLAQAWSGRGFANSELRQYDKAVADYSKAVELKPDYANAWYGRGFVYGHLRQYDKAVADYSKAIALKPDYDGAWYNRGIAYYNLRQYRKAVADYSKAIELKPDNDGAWYNRGIAYYNMRQHDKAVADNSKAIELKPDNAEAWTNRAMVYNDLRQYDKAIADCSKAIALKPDLAQAWTNRGTGYRNLDQYDKAIADHSKAIELKPDYAEAWTNRGNAYGALRQYDKAVADYSKAIELKPDLAEAWYGRGNAYRELHQNDKAVADYDKAIDLKPDYAEAWTNRGLAYRELGQYAKAVADYSKAIKLKPDLANAWSNRAAAYRYLGHYDKALADCSKAIELKPDNAEPWYGRGAAYLELRQYDKAVADNSKAIELKPDFAEAWAHRGNAYGALRQYSEALANYSKAIKLKPDLAVAWNNRGNTYGRLLQYDKAIADYSKAIELQPDYADIWAHRGGAYWYLRQYDKARADFSKAIELKPDYAQAWYGRGLAYADLRQYAKAVADYTKAIKLKPDHAEIIWYNRGIAYRKLHQCDKAAADYSKAIELKPDYAEAWFNRGIAYTELRQYGKAAADYSRAIELRPHHAETWYGRGLAYYNLRQYDKARADYSKAVELKADYAEAHCNLGWALQAQGRFAEALAALRRGHELGSKQPGWAHPSAKWVQQCARWLELDGKLPAALQSKLALSKEEKKEFGDLCMMKRWYAAAAGFYDKAYVEQKGGTHFTGIRAAALAGCGKGDDAAKVDDKERARWRQQALDWLNADLALWKKQLESNNPTARASAREMLENWLDNPDLAGVRHGKTLDQFSETEREAWRRLWAEVEALLKTESGVSK